MSVTAHMSIERAVDSAEGSTIRTYARVAGVMFIISMICGGIGEAYIPSRLIVASDPTATAGNIHNFEFLYRSGFAIYLVEGICDVALTAIFYLILRVVDRRLALLAALFGLLGTATFASAELFYLGPHIIFGTAGETGGFNTAQLNTLALMSLRFYAYGGMVFTVFYGLSWILRGYLIFKSGFIPKTLGVLMAIGGTGFAVRNFLLLLAPSLASPLLLVLLMPGALLLAVWLLVKGVDVAQWNAKAAVT